MNTLPSGDSLHDIIVRELFEMKSLAALIFLIDSGRELEFHYKGSDYFITRDNARENVVLCEGKTECKYNDMYQLISDAILIDTPFIEVWPQMVLDMLF